jgi:CrcB protein
LTVNLSGSLVYGAITGLGLYHAFPATPKLLLGTGACGAYTTFSTFALESVLLVREGERLGAALNLVVSVVAGCLAAAIGLALAAL